MKTHSIYIILISLVIITVGCALAGPQIAPIAATTETTAPTATVTSTAVPTATPEPTQDPYVLDSVKFHNFPESYEYVLAHADEFVRAPDPFTERAAFDRWWNEQLIPALGSVYERKIEMMGSAAYDNNATQLNVFPDHLVTGKPTGFFYFMDGDILRPVVVENVGNVVSSGFVVTMAVILCELVNGYFSEAQIRQISEGRPINLMTIITSPEEPMKTVSSLSSFEFVERVIEAGFKGDIDENRVAFGAGVVLMVDGNQ